MDRFKLGKPLEVFTQNLTLLLPFNEKKTFQPLRAFRCRIMNNFQFNSVIIAECFSGLWEEKLTARIKMFVFATFLLLSELGEKWKC